MQYATKASRMGAFIIDVIVIDVMVFGCAIISVPLGILMGVVGTTLYYGIMEGSGMHGTFGKYLMAIVTVGENGRPLDYGQSFTRAVCRYLSYLTLGIGFLIGLFDDEGKALHDRIAGTRIITKESLSRPVMAYGNQGMQHNVNPPMRQNMNQPMQANYAAQPKLIGVVGRYAGQAYLIGPQGLLMGRDQTACDFVLDGNLNGISRMHCKVVFNQQTGMFVLYDLGSSYGTYLGNGVRVPQGQPMALGPGEQFYLADRSCVFMVSL